MGRQVLGEFEQIVLLSVVRLAEAAFGRAIYEELARLSITRVTITAVYVTLARLEKKDFVSVQLAVPAGGGRSQKLFAITPPGLAALQRSREQLARFWAGVEVGEGAGR